MNISSTSLKKRLLKWISIPIVFSAVFIMLIAYLFSWHEIQEVYDAQLVHAAKTLLQLTKHELSEEGDVDISLGNENPELEHKYENKITFRIWHNDRLAIQSVQAKSLSELKAPVGFSDQTIKGKPWRVFVFVDPQKSIRVETAERYAIRYELAGQLIMSLTLPMIILFPILLIIIWFGVRRSLLPLIEVSADVDSRNVDDTHPITGKQIPDEIMPLVDAMNRLLLRISDSFKREREFTDNAAHELRTPLAAMKTQAQVLIKKTASLPECADGLQNLNASIDRTTHLIEQLLSLARLQSSTLPMASVDLSAILKEAIADIETARKNKNQSIKTDIYPGLIIKGHADSLFIMLRNLLDNAVKYTPADGTLQVSLSADRILRISDSGPGIADVNKERVFHRFVRVDKTLQVGSGLGLSIVRWIADAHGVRILLKDNLPTGLIIQINF